MKIWINYKNRLLQFCLVLVSFVALLLLDQKGFSQTAKPVDQKSNVETLAEGVANQTKKFNLSEKEILNKLYKKLIGNPKLKRRKVHINQWNSSNGLSTHILNRRSQTQNSFNFNLNLGYVRFYMRADIEDDSTYLFKPGFTYIIEMKPLDFTSLITSGSAYSIFMEKKEWLRNFTVIFANKTFASTEFITNSYRWYFDLLYNGIDITNSILTINRTSARQTSKSGLEQLYPTNRNESLGFSDHFHVFQTSRMALGIKAYFEFNFPEGNAIVAKNAVQGVDLGTVYSSSLTYAGMLALFFKYIDEDIEFRASVAYQRMEGDFDDWIVKHKQNTISTQLKLIISEMLVWKLNYLLNP